jgi:hypothetical protein
MDSHEHIAKAEQLLEDAPVENTADARMRMYQLAQVHALIAIAMALNYSGPSYNITEATLAAGGMQP